MRDSAATWHAATFALWLIALIAASSVSARANVAQQVPKADLARWNRAYKLSVRNFTQEQYPLLLSAPCSEARYDSDPTTVPLRACFYRKEPDGTYSFWSKRPGDWRENSNCYCYALNVYKGGFCIPGVTNPQIDAAIKNRDTFTCDLLRQAVANDGAKEVTRELAISSQPSTGQYIALMVRSDSCNPHHCWRNDFHAARKDADGFWTWKEPGGPASDKDLFGNKITDPSIAVLPGHYDHFCGFWWVDPATLIIGGVFTEQTLQDLVHYYKKTPGVQASVEPLPYNPAVDGSYDPNSQAQLNQDVDWENQRGSKAWDDYYNKQRGIQVDNTTPSDDPVITPINLNSGRTNVAQLIVDPTYGQVTVNAAVGQLSLGNLGGVNKVASANTGSLADRTVTNSSSSSSSSVLASNSSPLAPPVVTNSSGISSNSSSPNPAQPVPIGSTVAAGSTSGSTVAAGSTTGSAPGNTVAASNIPGNTVATGSTVAAGSTTGSTVANAVTNGATNNTAPLAAKTTSTSSGSSSKSNSGNAGLLPTDVNSSSNTSTPQMQQVLLKAAAAAVNPLPATAAAAAAGGARDYDATAATFQSVSTSGGDATAAAAANSQRKEAAAVVRAAAAATNQQLLRGNSASSSSSTSTRLPSKPPAGGKPGQPLAAKVALAAGAGGGRRDLREKPSQRSR